MDYTMTNEELQGCIRDTVASLKSVNGLLIRGDTEYPWLSSTLEKHLDMLLEIQIKRASLAVYNQSTEE